MTLFGRQTVLEVGPPGETGKAWSELRVKFKVKHTRSSASNKATIEVYNLGDESIDYLRKDGHVVRLLAGYNDPTQIFAGRIKEGGFKQPKTQKADKKVKLELLDGNTELKRSRLNFSFQSGTTIRRILDRITSEVDLANGFVELPNNVRLNQGVTVTGTPEDALDRVAEAAGADWWIQDRKIRFIAEGQDSGERAAVFSAETGTLVGRPSPGKGEKIEVTGLLRPRLRPGDLFKLDDDRYGGFWRARDVTFDGDSGWSDKYYVIVTAVPR